MNNPQTTVLGPAVKETLQGLDNALCTLRELLAAIERREATTAFPDGSTDTFKTFSESSTADSLARTADGLKLVTTVLSTAGDGDMELTGGDLRGLSDITHALRRAVEDERQRAD